MERHTLHYETMLKLARAISLSKDPEEVALITTESVKSALKAKGCALFLINHKTNELEIAASYGLSDNYLNKGPISSLHSIAQSLYDGPVGIYDVSDDPRIQYPEEAKNEGIASILAVPIMLHGRIFGTLRVYTTDHWEFTLNDVNFVQAVSIIAGLSLDICRLHKGYKKSIDILKTMRDTSTVKSRKWTPYEGVPVSVAFAAASE